jgi:hypothetical protein
MMPSALVGVGYCGVNDLNQGFDWRTSGRRMFCVLSGNDTVVAQAGEEIEEVFVCGLVVEEA